MKPSYPLKAFVGSNKQVQDFVCGICHEVHTDDMCGSRNCCHVFGKWCIKAWQDTGSQLSQQCPICKEPYSSIENRRVEHKIGMLPMKCQYRGCKKKCSVAEMRRHIIICDPFVVECNTEGCKSRMKRCKIKDHLCPYEIITCTVPNCGETFQRRQLESHNKKEQKYHEM